MSVIDQALSDFFKHCPIPAGTTVGVAVSGGADSLCLTFHLAAWAEKNRVVLKAATVNHGLRPEANKEAEQVHRQLLRRHIAHTTLLWRGAKPKTHVEEKAREKRYELLFEWCRKEGISYLFLAHHRGDQAETFWARLARGSGVDGLSAMALQSPTSGITLCRPFLSIDKADCEADLRQHRIPWVHDPMNEDEVYERVRWRHRQALFNEMGLTLPVIDRTTRRLRRAREALDFYTNRFMQALVEVVPQGYASVSYQALSSLPAEIQIRVIGRLIACINPVKRPLSLEALERWQHCPPRLATLGGCVLVRQKDTLFVVRETARLSALKTVPAGQPVVWNQFVVMASVPVCLTFGSQDKDLPPVVRQAIPRVKNAGNITISFVQKSQKELEKQFALDYKKRKSEFVLISFRGVL